MTERAWCEKRSCGLKHGSLGTSPLRLGFDLLLAVLEDRHAAEGAVLFVVGLLGDLDRDDAFLPELRLGAIDRLVARKR